MLKRMSLAAAAFALTTPAMAACLEDSTGAQCDIFLERYMSDEIPVGTTMIWPEDQFVIDDFDQPGVGTPADNFLRDDVYVWDGQQAHIVPDVSGPPIPLARW